MNSPEDFLANNTTINSPQGSSNHDIRTLRNKGTDFVENNSLEKVRDILFGNQMRDVDKRLARMEERLQKDFTNLRDETRKSLDSLENYIKQEVDSLTEKLKKERAEREQAVSTLSLEQKNTANALDGKFAQLDEEATTKTRELREQLLNQSKTLHDEIRQKYEEILAVLDREASELRHQKTDRSSLAALFTELAIRLNSQV